MSLDKLALFLVLALECTISSAGTPMDVLGLSLNSPLNMPVCERGRGISPKAPSTGICSGREDALTPGFNGRVGLIFADGDLPSWTDPAWFGAPVRGQLLDGRLVGVEIATTGAAVSDQVLGILTKKYGKPNQKTSMPVQNGYGATFKTDWYKWNLKDLYVEYLTIGGSLESGRVYIATKEGAAFRDKERQESDAKSGDGNRPL